MGQARLFHDVRTRGELRKPCPSPEGSAGRTKGARPKGARHPAAARSSEPRQALSPEWSRSELLKACEELGCSLRAWLSPVEVPGLRRLRQDSAPPRALGRARLLAARGQQSGRRQARCTGVQRAAPIGYREDESNPEGGSWHATGRPFPSSWRGVRSRRILRCLEFDGVRLQGCCLAASVEPDERRYRKAIAAAHRR